PANRDERGRASTPITAHAVVPDDPTGQRVEAEDVPIRGHDQPVPVQQQSDIAGLKLVVGPDDFARVAVQCHRVSVQADEHELFDALHGSQASFAEPLILQLCAAVYGAVRVGSSKKTVKGLDVTMSRSPGLALAAVRPGQNELAKTKSCR